MPGYDRTHRTITVERRADPVLLESGLERPGTVVDLEIWGSSPENPILLLIPPLTCPAAAVGERIEGRGWWDDQIGPGRSLDTDRFTIIALRPQLGEREGSEGEPAPLWTIRDIVHLQRDALHLLGVTNVAAIVGPSFGGMVALEWGILYPDFSDALITIGTGSETNARRLALNLVGLRILELDGGSDADRLALARSLALLCYRGTEELDIRFGRGRDGEGWLVGWYLERQGEKFVERMSRQEYGLLLHALNSHDVGRDRGGAVEALRRISVPTLCVGISSDRLYPVDEVRRLAGRIPKGEYREIESVYGHDAFLIEAELLRDIIPPFLDRIATEPSTTTTINRESDTCVL